MQGYGLHTKPPSRENRRASYCVSQPAEPPRSLLGYVRAPQTCEVVRHELLSSLPGSMAVLSSRCLPLPLSCRQRRKRRRRLRQVHTGILLQWHGAPAAFRQMRARSVTQSSPLLPEVFHPSLAPLSLQPSPSTRRSSTNPPPPQK